MSAATSSSTGPRRKPTTTTTSTTTTGSSTSPRRLTHATSPPTTSLSTPAAAASSTGALQSTLPSPETQRHIAEARAAVVASIGNMLDSELQTRASILHGNAAALEKQERDVVRATEGLRRERERLAKEADRAARKVKELGNVQNWAEVLERGFLVLEETVRLANGGSDEENEGGTCSCSCSECEYRGDEEEEVEGMGEEGGEADGSKDGEGKGKGREVVDVDMMLDGDAVPSTWSDASRSLTDAKGSETASTAS